MKAVRLGAALALVGLLACERYQDNDTQILTAYTAKQICSCVFVMKRSDDFCLAWAKEDPDVKTASIDRKHGVVETQALALWGARARFKDARRGCVLESDD